MSLLGNAEIRYSAISMVALIIITRVLNFMALQSPTYTPIDKKAGKATVNWSNLSFSSISDIGNTLSTVIGNFTTMTGNFTSVLDGWLFLIGNAGWASAFVLVPALIMFMVILNTTYQIVKALPYT